MKRILLPILLLTSSASYAVDSAQEVRLIYPQDAVVVGRLDSSTPTKRATPPVKEETEFDPVTPIGQIRNVVASLDALQEGQESLASDVASIKKNSTRPIVDRTDEILDALENNHIEVDLSTVASKEDIGLVKEELDTASKERIELANGLKTIADSNRIVSGKVDAIAKNVENVQTSVDSIPESIVIPQRSKFIDACVILIVALVLLQIVVKIVSTIVATIKEQNKEREERIAAEAYARAERDLKKVR